ncbi:catalase [Nocardia sp. NPDC052316]|uniref:catalase n=1 Tax=Nocardia sp. NPDC052316 TaxID=3364329 RepID=UPI0037C599BC
MTETPLTPTEVGEHLAEVLPAAPGERLQHRRGACAVGVFHPDPAAATLSTAALFAEPAPVRLRFSGTRGGTDGHDAYTGDQGLSVRFTPADGPPSDLITFTLPVFFVRTGADMFDFITASSPEPATGQPNPAALAEFRRRHPESAAALAAATDRAPASYLGQQYYAIHAFGLTNAAGHITWARLEWHPTATLPSLDPHEAGKLPPDYLTTDLARRLPATMTLYARLPAAGDPLHDPTALWADPPQLVRLGELRLETPTDDEDLDFDPLRLPPGITPPRDQLAADRSTVYRVVRTNRHRALERLQNRARPSKASG